MIQVWISGLFLMALMACGTNSNTEGAASELVTAKELAKMIQTIPNLQLVDVRTPKEYSEGHLKGAVNINYHDDDFETQLAALDKERPTVLYCARGGRSHKAYVLGESMKFSQLYDLKGGYTGWVTAQ